MNGKLSIREFVAVCGIAGAVLILEACGQQIEGQREPTVAGTSQALTQDSVTPPGQACVPTGKHQEHRAFDCAACHQCAGTLSFDAAVAGPSAAFDATTKNCSNVACHSVPAGTYTYLVWDYSIDEGTYVSVPYGGTASAGTANWYAAPGTTGCTACHGYPPTYNGAAYTWHSGMHAGTTTASGNACQLCHPDARGAYVYGGPPSYVGTSGGLISSCAPGTFCAAPGTITTSAHGNGVVDVVVANWNNACFGCH